MKQSLSVIVITKNEADRIERCLRSVERIADEIILFDSGSNDNTIEIAQKFTNFIYQTDWQGYGIQKQRALEKATCDWVLSIDADEEVDQKLAENILKLLSQETNVYSAYKVRWKSFLIGKPTRFGRTARAPIRLFLRDGAQFDEEIVHEKVLHKGKLSQINEGYLNHYSIRNFDHLCYKNRLYSLLMAEKYFNRKKKSLGIPFAILRGLITFIQIYFFRLSILDGNRGLLSSIMFAQYTFNKYAALWSLEQESKLKDN
jgi:glycosyltransferase involved in cell wall biosynthesis